jgi:aspartate oxidase
MKEKKITIKKIIDTLIKKSFIEIVPICDECAAEIIGEVIPVFGAAHFDIFQVEDGIYCLRINV